MGIAAADGRPTFVNGTVLLEDHITPLKNVHIILKKNDLRTIASNSYTDHVGAFSMSGILHNESYVIEIDSPEYLGSKEIIVKPNRENLHEIFAHKR